MADIGPLVVKLTASAKGVAAGMREAGKYVRDGASAMAQDAARAGQAVGQKLAGGIAAGLKAGLKYGAIGAGAGILAGGAVGIAGLVEGSKHILDVGKAAESAGADLASMQTITGVLGGDVEAASSAVTKFRQALLEAGLAGDESDDVFRRLGLDVQALLAMPVADALGGFAEQFKLLDGAVSRQREAVALWGDDLAAKLLPTLTKGGAEIERVRDLLGGFGASFGAGDLATAREAQRLWQQVGFLKQGFSNQMALGLTPIFAELQSRFPDLSKLGLTAAGLKSVVLDVAEGIAKAGGYLFEAFRKPAEILGPVWEGLLSMIESGVYKIMAIVQRGIGQTLQMIPGFDAAGASVLKQAEFSQRRAGVAWGAGLARFGDSWDEFLDTGTGKGLTGLFAGARARQMAGAIPGIGPLLTGGRDNREQWMEQAIRQFSGQGGGGDPVAEFSRFAALLQARPPGVAERDAWANLLGQPGWWADPKGKAWGANPGVWGTLPIPQPWLASAAGGVGLLGRGFAGGDPFAPGGALAGLDAKKGFELYQKLLSAHGSALQYTPTPAMERGSSEAFSAIAQYQASTGDAVEAMKRLLGAANDLAEEQNRIGQEIADAVKAGGFVKVKGVP